MKQRRARQLVSGLAERLDRFLDRTLEIEEAQMNTRDPATLQAHLDDVTRVKLAALRELTHEDLRGDRRFSIFLMQCANLITKISAKIDTYSVTRTEVTAQDRKPPGDL